MTRLAQVTLAPAAAVVNNVAQSQTPGAAGNLTLNGAAVSGGIATLDVARRLLFTFAANESAKTLTITGTSRSGAVQTETITGGNAVPVTTLKDFKTVSQIAVSAAFTGAVQVGTGGVVSSQWIPCDHIATENFGFQVVVSGTVNYTVEHSYDAFQGSGVGVQPPGGAVEPYLNPFPHPTIAAQTGSKDGAYVTLPIMAIRVTLNSFTAPGQVVFTVVPGPTL